MMDSRVLTIATQIMVISIILSVMLLFLGMGVLVLLHICIVGRAFRMGLNTVPRGGERRGGDEPGGLSPDDFESLPCYEFDARGNDCAVCLEAFQKGDRCRLLPLCGHSFHAACVDSWLMRTPVCPLCRARACRRKGEEEGLELGGFRAVVAAVTS